MTLSFLYKDQAANNIQLGCVLGAVSPLPLVVMDGFLSVIHARLPLAACEMTGGFKGTT